MQTLLALDLGTTSGFCIGHDRASNISGTANFKPSRYDGGGMRFVKFRAWLGELKAAYPVDRVVFEEVRRHAGTDAAHVYGGLMATLTAWCEENKIPYEGVSVGTIKAGFTGKGNASKEMMIAEAIKRGYAPMTHDEADAVALWHCKIGEMPQGQPTNAARSEMED
jgi:Holliday junction resolvasome RuvABC endonuclease subunit